MLLSIEYELNLQHVPVHESARVDLPLHLYGALAACSEESMAYLKDNVNLQGIVKLALSTDDDRCNNGKHVDATQTAVDARRHRAALYALGHIGARELGFRYLNECIDGNIVPQLIHLAETCTTLSLRGAYMTVLGMLSRCAGGTHALVRHGWSIPGPTGTKENGNKGGNGRGTTGGNMGGMGGYNGTSAHNTDCFDDDEDLEEVGEVEGVTYRLRKSSTTTTLLSSDHNSATASLVPNASNASNASIASTWRTRTSSAMLDRSNIEHAGSSGALRTNSSSMYASPFRHSNVGVSSSRDKNQFSTLVTTSLVALPSPNRINRFFTVDGGQANRPSQTKENNRNGKKTEQQKEQTPEQKGPAEPEYIAKALGLFSSLSSPITRSDAYKDFKSLKTKSPELTSDPRLLSKVLDMMETYQMSLSVRRYLLGDLWRVAQRTPSSGPDHQGKLWRMLAARRK